MDSKLPSLSIYWIKYHDIGIRAIHEKDYSGAVSSIYSMNALLPEEYRLEIDNDKFNQLSKEQLKASCPKCKEECDRENLKIIDLVLPVIASFLLNKKTVRGWLCPKCDNTNHLEKTLFKKLQNARPFYYKVIPQAPNRQDGMVGRTSYHIRIEKWFYSSLEELDHQLGLYRKEYEPLSSRDDVTDLEEDVQY